MPEIKDEREKNLLLAKSPNLIPMNICSAHNVEIPMTNYFCNSVEQALGLAIFPSYVQKTFSELGKFVVPFQTM